MNDGVKVEFRRGRRGKWRQLRDAKMHWTESSLVVMGMLALVDAPAVLAMFNGMHTCQLRVADGRRQYTVDSAYVASVEVGDRRVAKVQFRGFGRVHA